MPDRAFIGLCLWVKLYGLLWAVFEGRSLRKNQFNPQAFRCVMKSAAEMYVYDEKGDLIEDFREKVMSTLTRDMKPTDEQKMMIKNASSMPVV